MSEKEKRVYLLEQENVKKALLKLGIPTMIGLLVSALYNIVDAFFVGQLGTMQIAAVSVVYPVTMIGTGIGLLFGSGAGSYVSRLLGKKEFDNVSAVSSTTVISGIVTISTFVGAMLLFFEPLMKVLGVTEGIMPYAKEYGLIYIAGLIFNVFNVMVNNMLVAEGASSFSMTAMMIGGCTNIVMDPVLIFGCGMGIKGAALATLFSRMVSTGLYLSYLLRGKSYMKVSFKRFQPTASLYSEIFKIGVPICIIQLLTGVTVSLTNVMAKPYGETAIAAMGIVNRFMSIEVSALYGFLKGYSPLVGYNYGAGNLDRVKDSTNIALRLSTIVNILFGIICIVFSREIIHLFNRESVKVLEIGKMALTVDAVSFMTLGLQIVIGNYFLAIGKAKQGGILSICRQGVFFIPFLLVFTYVWGLTGLIMAQLGADLSASFLTLIMWKKEKA